MLTLVLFARSNSLHIRSDQDHLRNAGCPSLVHDEQHPESRDDDAGVIGDGGVVTAKDRHTPEVQGHAALVGVDGVGGAAEADQGSGCDPAVGVEVQGSSDRDGTG